MKKVAYFLLFLFLFICILGYASMNWAIKTFAFLNFDEIIFQLTTPLQATESSIIKSYVAGSIFPSVIIALFVIPIVLIIYHYLNTSSIQFNLRLWKTKKSFNIKSIYLKILFTLLLIIIPITIVFSGLQKINLISYVERNYLNDSVDFFKTNYIDPKNTKITFPEKKRNLIYIYVESLETSYFDEEHGGISSDNVLSPLEELTNENTMFSNTDYRGGFYSYLGTTYTSASLVAQTSGVPLKISVDDIDNSDHKYKSLLPGAYTLNDILTKEGYNQTFMMGSDKAFGSRDVYFENHGNMNIFDYNSAIEAKKIPKTYNVWWGYEDSKLFEYSKEEALHLASQNKPFNLTILTANTHHPDGYVEKDCPTTYNSNYSNSIYCSATQIKDFINWCKEQNFYQDTTIIIVGDHFTYKTGYLPEDKYLERTVYNLFINSAVSTDNTKNRLFSAMDMYPTTLASLGVTIDGDRLGIGTNLYSDKKTFAEELGLNEFNDVLSYSSKFYLDNILKEGN